MQWFLVLSTLTLVLAAEGETRVPVRGSTPSANLSGRLPSATAPRGPNRLLRVIRRLGRVEPDLALRLSGWEIAEPANNHVGRKHMAPSEAPARRLTPSEPQGCPR